MRYLKTLLDLHKNAKAQGLVSEISPSKTSITLRSGKAFIHVEADRKDKNVLNVPVLLVPREASGQGVGKRLVGYVCEHCDHNGVRMSLSASPFGWMSDHDTPRVLAFYARFGFVPDRFGPYGTELVREPHAKPEISRFPRIVVDGFSADLSEGELADKLLDLGANTPDGVNFDFFDGTVNIGPESEMALDF